MALLCLSGFYTKRKTLVVFPYKDWAALEPSLTQPLQMEQEPALQLSTITSPRVETGFVLLSIVPLHLYSRDACGTFTDTNWQHGLKHPIPSFSDSDLTWLFLCFPKMSTVGKLQDCLACCHGILRKEYIFTGLTGFFLNQIKCEKQWWHVHPTSKYW